MGKCEIYRVLDKNRGKKFTSEDLAKKLNITKVSANTCLKRMLRLNEHHLSVKEIPLQNKNKKIMVWLRKR